MNIQRTVMFILLFAVVLRIDTGSETPPSSLDHRPRASGVSVAPDDEGVSLGNPCDGEL